MLAKLALWSAGFTNQVIDYYLSQDADYYHDLCSLINKEIIFYVSDLHLEVKLHCTRTQVKISYEKALIAPILQDEHCLCLEGRSFDLLAFAFKKAQRSSLLSEQVVRYQGDLLLLEALLKLFKDRDFFANVALPDSVKAVLLKGGQVAFHWQKQNVKALKAAMIDYFQEELRCLPSHQHFELLKAEFLALDERVDRLDAKLMSVTGASEACS